MLTRRSLLAASTAAGMFAAARAGAQTYPARPIKIILPFPAGGPTDAVARLVADKLAVSLGQPVIVENRAGGAGGTVGAKAAATADPDGYTLLCSAPGPLVTAPAIYKNAGYDPIKDFTPVANLFSSPQMMVVHPGVPARSVRELVDYAKARPGMLGYASPGVGTQPHLLGAMFGQLAGVDIVHIPYRGTAPAITDMLGGQVQLFIENIAAMLPHIQAGKLLALALADEARNPLLPDVPTTAESGFPKLQGTFWVGIVAPAGTPAGIVDRLNAAINDLMRSKDIEANLARLSATAKLGTPADFAAFMTAETKKWREVIDAAGIKAE
jgi:tripartite-type tricarboxylate transporter receptor subunit TctC